MIGRSASKGLRALASISSPKTALTVATKNHNAFTMLKTIKIPRSSFAIRPFSSTNNNDNKMAIFQEYYDAFERFYDNNDPAEIMDYLAENVTYDSPASGFVEGRDQVIQAWSTGLHRFDKRFPVKRSIVIDEDALVATDDYVKMPGDVLYPTESGPTLTVYMTEELWYEGDKIVRILDTIEPPVLAKIQAFLQENETHLAY